MERYTFSYDGNTATWGDPEDICEPLENDCE